MTRRACHGLLAVLCLRATSAACGAGQIPPAIDDQPVSTFIENALTEHHIPGMAVALVLDGEVAWAKGFGFADIGTKRLVSPDTLFVMGSVSKTVVAAALMHAVEDGRLSLEADINRVLPFPVHSPQFPTAIISARELATHSSGILDNDPVYEGSTNYHYGGDNPISLGAFLAAYLTPGGALFNAAGNFSLHTPGAEWHYSNVGAALAGFLVESASGMPFDAYCRKFIFEPLGMLDTGWHQSDVNMARHAIPYASVGTQFVPYQNYGLATWPDGGLRTTVLDFGRFVGMIMQGGSLRGVRVMQAATVQAMLAPQDVTIEYDGFPKGSVRQAIFWMIGSVGGKDSQRYWHTGSDPGAATLVTLDVRRRIGVVAFVNTDATSVISADVQHVVDLIFKATGR